jgi:hypothetical protein
LGKFAPRHSPLARLPDFAHISHSHAVREGGVWLALQFGPGED